MDGHGHGGCFYNILQCEFVCIAFLSPSAALLLDQLHLRQWEWLLRGICLGGEYSSTLSLSFLFSIIPGVAFDVP